MSRLVLAYKVAAFVVTAACCVLMTACEPAKNRTGFASLLVQNGKDVTKPARLKFPQDHLAHPEYGIEWWYLTANLTNQNNESLWIQWTLFRVRNQGTQNNWANDQFYMAHFSVHSQKNHASREMFASGGVGNVEVSSEVIRINNWQLQKTPSGLPSNLTVKYWDDEQGSEVSIALQLNTESHYLLQGDKGYSLKHPKTDLASYYYSLPHIGATGSVSFSGETHSVTGNAWYDHEWSSMFLSQDFTGWTWFSLHLQDNSKLTLFTLLPTQDSAYNESWYGAMMTKDGVTKKLDSAEIVLEELNWQDSALGELPTSWHIKIESLVLDLQLKVKKSQQISPFSIPYFEGAVDVSGSHQGVGFVEMTR